MPAERSYNGAGCSVGEMLPLLAGPAPPRGRLSFRNGPVHIPLVDRFAARTNTARIIIEPATQIEKGDWGVAKGLQDGLDTKHALHVERWDAAHRLPWSQRNRLATRHNRLSSGLVGEAGMITCRASARATHREPKRNKNIYKPIKYRCLGLHTAQPWQFLREETMRPPAELQQEIFFVGSTFSLRP